MIVGCANAEMEVNAKNGRATPWHNACKDDFMCRSFYEMKRLPDSKKMKPIKAV